MNYLPYIGLGIVLLGSYHLVSDVNIRPWVRYLLIRVQFTGGAFFLGVGFWMMLLRSMEMIADDNLGVGLVLFIAVGCALIYLVIMVLGGLFMPGKHLEKWLRYIFRLDQAR